jgi:hypothetical protein
MKRLLFFLAVFIQIQCLGNAYADLTAIHYDRMATRAAGKNFFNVTIKSSDGRGSVTLLDGNKSNIQNLTFHLEFLKDFSFTIPWQGWDGDATVHVKVKRENELISQMDLQDRASTIKVIGIKNAETKNISKIKKHRTCRNSCSGDNCNPCSYSDIECSLDIQLSVDPITGFISVSSADFVDCPADDVDPNSFFVN